MSDTIIHWFRQDLRLTDNPSLYAASKTGRVLPVFIVDQKNAGEHSLGAASRCWLHNSLTTLNQALDNRLQLYCGDPESILLQLTEQKKVTAVYWNRCYEPWRIKRDKKIKAALKDKGIQVHSFNGSLLWEPRQLLKKDNSPYQVFTPFYRHALRQQAPRVPLERYSDFWCLM